MKLGSRLLIGALAGIAGTMAMGATVRRLQKRLPAKRRDPDATDEPTSRSRGPGPDLKLAVHFAYGAGCGALLAASSPRIGRYTGAAAGGAIWLGSQMGWLPPLYDPQTKAGHPLRRHAVTIAAHFSWGWSTGLAIRELGAAHGTINVSELDPSAPSRVKSRA